MTLLELVQALQTECGVSGSITTTVGLVGSQARLLTWINRAWQAIQTRHEDWGWMRSSNVLGAGASFATVAGQASYLLGTGAGTIGVTAANFGKWDRETFRSYTTTVGTSDEITLDEIPFDAWRDGYMIGALRTVQTRPVVVAIGPNNSVCLGPPPTALYTITADYFVAPSAMSGNTDTPTGLPAQFHYILVYKAMQYYASYESAPEVMNAGEAGYEEMLGQLENLRLPQMSFAGALV